FFPAGQDKGDASLYIKARVPFISVPFISPGEVEGRYRYVQYPHFDMGKLCILVGMVEERRIRLTPDGSILVDQGIEGPWQPLAPLLYGRGEDRLAFRQDASGKTVGLIYGTWAFERIHWYEGRRAQTALIGLLTGAFLFAIVARIFTRSRNHAR